MKSDIVSAAVTDILRQAETDEKFRKDFEKIVGDVYEAGREATKTVVNAPPLAPEEIAAFRDFVRASK